MIHISAVIITKNEEATIRRCIESLLSVSDEIIVMDSFSDDATEAICKQFSKLSFFQHPFDNYADQKNRANALSKNNYVLSLDADELLSDELIKAIEQIKCSDKTEKAYRFPRLNTIAGKQLHHGLWFPDRKIRLFHKEFGSWIGTGVHETLEVKNATIKDLTAPILHFPYASTHEFEHKFEKYSSIWAQHHADNGKKVNVTSAYLHAAWTAFRGLIIKLAFLDGKVGLALLKAQTKDSFLKYKKLYRLNKHGRF